MAHIFSEPSRTFSEYLLVPGYSSCDCTPANVSLKTPLVKYKKGEEPALSMNIPKMCIRDRVDPDVRGLLHEHRGDGHLGAGHHEGIGAVGVGLRHHGIPEAVSDGQRGQLIALAGDSGDGHRLALLGRGGADGHNAVVPSERCV